MNSGWILLGIAIGITIDVFYHRYAIHMYKQGRKDEREQRQKSKSTEMN